MLPGPTSEVQHFYLHESEMAETCTVNFPIPHGCSPTLPPLELQKWNSSMTQEAAMYDCLGFRVYAVVFKCECYALAFGLPATVP